ncbi:MAG: hypothetical protein AAGK02_01775 [Pseudomonadota bacterium]
MKLAAPLVLSLAIAVVGCAYTGTAKEGEPGTPGRQAASDFVGLYNGSSFETYMAMRIVEDGTFEWVLAVGALDMRSQGTWVERNGIIYFTTEPAPVPAEFRFLRFETAKGESENDRLVHVFRPDGTQFVNAEARIECANGARVFEFVAGSTAYLDGYTPDECDHPIAVRVIQSNYDITSPRYDLIEMGWEKGQIMRFEFESNDIGVLDLTGMSGALADSILTVAGPLGREEFRKVQPRENE